MRRLVAWLMLAGACGGGGSGGVSLEGPYDCGSIQCKSGELCRRFAAGVDAGTGSGSGDGECVAPPSDCFAFSCAGAGCQSCIQDMCFGFGCTACVSLSGRDLTCGGQ